MKNHHRFLQSIAKFTRNGSDEFPDFEYIGAGGVMVLKAESEALLACTHSDSCLLGATVVVARRSFCPIHVPSGVFLEITFGIN